MTQENLIQLIKRKAQQDRKNRHDRRFLEAMGFLTAKGFLRTNQAILPQPNRRLRIDEVIWAGENVEPRILEVLPAAVLRLGKHFDFDPERHPDLARVLTQLRKREGEGRPFHGIPYEKLKVWAEFPLLDKRVKTANSKKNVKTFRLDFLVVDRLKKIARQRNCTETEVIETLILASLPTA